MKYIVENCSYMLIFCWQVLTSISTGFLIASKKKKSCFLVLYSFIFNNFLFFENFTPVYTLS